MKPDMCRSVKFIAKVFCGCQEIATQACFVLCNPFKNVVWVLCTILCITGTQLIKKLRMRKASLYVSMSLLKKTPYVALCGMTSIGPKTPYVALCGKTSIGPKTPYVALCGITSIGPKTPYVALCGKTSIGPKTPYVALCGITSIGPKTPYAALCGMTSIGPKNVKPISYAYI
jgi:hypothetical protein